MTTPVVLKYNEPIEVTEKQYFFLTSMYSGLIVRRQEEGKYFIKLWVMQFKTEIEHLLNTVK